MKHLSIILLLCICISATIAEQQTMNHAEHDMMEEPVPEFNSTGAEPMSYALFPANKDLFYTHVAFMVLAFWILMPIGVMLGIAHSSLHVPVQLLMFVFAMGGFFFGKLYGHSTPHLYAGNVHHSFGWFLFLLLCVQVSGGVVRKIANAVNKRRQNRYEAMGLMHQRGSQSSTDGASSVVSEATTLNHNASQGGGIENAVHHEAEENEDNALMADIELEDPYHAGDVLQQPKSKVLLAFRKVSPYIPQFVKTGLTAAADNRFTSTFCRYLHWGLGRLFIVFIFTQTISGLVVYHGVCRDWEIFGCIAHLIKGAIFYFYGMITFARYLGAFAEKGWAWNNIKDQNTFSFEMIECSLIFFYGITNTWLEHLGNDDAWTHKDLEHASLAFMFWWAGLLGILIESRTVRRLLERVIPTSITATRKNTSPDSPDDMLGSKKPYAYYDSSSFETSSSSMLTTATMIPAFSLHFNPMPALTIFMTGVSMGNHHQDTLYSSRVHYLWGLLISAAAVCRIVTYFILFLNPPKTSQPSRPPSEAAGAFLLTGGAILFMASNAGTILFLRRAHVDSMFLLNLTVSFTSMTLVYVTFLMIVKAWAMKRESRKRKEPSTTTDTLFTQQHN